MSILLAMPTIRQPKLEYLGDLVETVDRILIIDDSDGQVEFHHGKAEVFDYKRMLDYCGGKDIVPHKSRACAMFGSFYGWREGFETTLFMDDDLEVYANRMRDALCRIGLWGSYDAISSPNPNAWANPITAIPNVYARGFPHLLRGREVHMFRIERVGRLVALLGLWDGVLDLSAVDKLAGYSYEAWQKPLESPLMVDCFFPISGMCLLHRDVLPAYPWAPSMQVLPQFRLNRWDDTYPGYILQTLVKLRKDDLMGWAGPLAIHRKETGDTVKEAVDEFLGFLIAPEIYQAVSEAHLLGKSYLEDVVTLGRWLSAYEFAHPYLSFYGNYLLEWMELFAKHE